MTSGQLISKLKHDKKYDTKAIEQLEKEHKVLQIIKENVFLDESGDIMPKNSSKSQREIVLLRSVLK